MHDLGFVFGVCVFPFFLIVSNSNSTFFPLRLFHCLVLPAFFSSISVVFNQVVFITLVRTYIYVYMHIRSRS